MQRRSFLGRLGGALFLPKTIGEWTEHERPCQNCGSDNVLYARFCWCCGKAMPGLPGLAEDKISSSHAGLELGKQGRLRVNMGNNMGIDAEAILTNLSLDSSNPSRLLEAAPGSIPYVPLQETSIQMGFVLVGQPETWPGRTGVSHR